MTQHRTNKDLAIELGVITASQVTNADEDAIFPIRSSEIEARKLSSELS